MKCRINIQPSEPTVLLYNIADENKAEIEMIAQRLCAKAVFVAKDEYSIPIAGIIDGKTDGKKMSDEPFDEPMIIMHGVDVDSALRLLRESGVKIGLKAVTTPSNLRWDSQKIYTHLSAEREAFYSKSREDKA